MGFFLTVVYFLVYFLTPTYLFGPLAHFRIELILAVLILVVSLPELMRSYVFKTPQTIALAGLSFAVSCSILFGMHWPGGAVHVFFDFLPNIYAYFLVCLHCNSKRRLEILILMLLFVCLLVETRGASDLLHGLPPGGPPINPQTGTMDKDVWNAGHPFLLPMKSDTGEFFYRLRGLGEINDPNDFGQILVCEIPLLFLFWRPKKNIRNFAFVILPSCLLLVAIYLTHSRGALVALAAVVLVAARRRIGAVAAVVVAGGLLAGALALQFTGGRALSVGAGEERTALWGGGLQILKSYPLFGVGFNQLADYIGQTAHNSIVVCVAELGLFGLFFWALFLLATARSTLQIALPQNVQEAEITEADENPSLFTVWKGPALNKAETNRVGHCLLLCLTGFLVAGCFLSRAFVLTFFLLGGMVEVIYEAVRRRGMVATRLPLKRLLVYSAELTVALVAAVYCMLRILNMMH